MSPLTPYQEQFLMKEYAALRKEILQTLKEAREVERNVAAAVALVLAWAGKDILDGKQQLTEKFQLIWWIPVVLVLLGMARSFAILRLFRILTEYIKQIELLFVGSADVKGWEHFSEPQKSFISWTGALMWAVLLIATLVVALKFGI